MINHVDELVAFNTEREPVFSHDIVWAENYIQDWLKLKLSTGVCTKPFIRQLAVHWCRVEQTIGKQRFLVDVHEVFDQIGSMEGNKFCRPQATGPENKFKRQPITGLWKKHFHQAAFLPKVLSNVNGRHKDEFVRTALNFCRGKNNEYEPIIDAHTAGVIAHQSVFGAHEKIVCPSTKDHLTGEWIVFAKYPERNIYIGLFGHGDDQIIFNSTRRAIVEFPELQDLDCMLACSN